MNAVFDYERWALKRAVERLREKIILACGFRSLRILDPLERLHINALKNEYSVEILLFAA
jgi:hypothetical protein